MFIGGDTSKPLSWSHDTSQWKDSTIGQLHAKTNGQIFIREISRLYRSAEMGWRVVDARFQNEDSTITYFRAFDELGDPQPFASFGVTYNGCERRILEPMKFTPEFGRNYLIPVENKFHTPNTGGYTAQVLDTDYPSEGIAFGLFKQDRQHMALVISFRLFELFPSYPREHQGFK